MLKQIFDFIFATTVCIGFLLVIGKLQELDNKQLCKPHSPEYISVKYYDGECSEWPKSFVKLGRNTDE